jgi:ribonuclease D
MQYTSIIAQAEKAAARPLLLEDNGQLLTAAKIWGSRAVLGIDTEFLRERTYWAQLGLVQVSDGRTAWLVDTLRLKNLEPLKQLLADPGIMKVLHSASEDLEVLWNTLGVAPQPMVDTQIACAMLGQPLQMSYHHAVKWLTGVEVDKELTRSNWIRRPLKPGQLHYAATDVVFLPAMLEELRTGLTTRGRWSWLEEDVADMVLNSQQEVEPASAYLRVKGSGRFDVPSLHVLQALAAWREHVARKRNRARGFVVPDSALMQLAEKKPQSVAELEEFGSLHPKALRLYQDDILEIICRNRDSQEPIEQALPLTNRQRRLINAMRGAVQAEARRLQVDPAILASKKQLEALLRAYESGAPIPDRLSGWREREITRKLLKLMESRKGPDPT